MGATHEQCTQASDCAVFTKFCRGCVTCGFYKPEAERRKSLPLSYCEDGLYRKFVRKKQEDDDT